MPNGARYCSVINRGLPKLLRGFKIKQSHVEPVETYSLDTSISSV